MRTRAFILAVLAALSLPTLAAAAEVTGFQLQADGVFVSPFGRMASFEGSKMSDLFGSGGGFSVTASMGLTRHFFAALRVESFNNGEKGQPFAFTDLPLVGGAPPPGSGPYTMVRRLDAVPLVGLVQYRHIMKSHLGWFLEAGGGVISFDETLALRGASGELLEIPGYQRDPAYALGAGLSVPVGMNLDVVAGGRFYGSVASDGALFTQGSDAHYVSASLGLRYPRVTH